MPVINCMATRRLNECLAFSIEWNWLWIRRMDSVMDRHGGTTRTHTEPLFLLCKFVYMTNTNSNEFRTFFLSSAFLTFPIESERWWDVMAWGNSLAPGLQINACIIELCIHRIYFICHRYCVLSFSVWPNSNSIEKAEQKYLRNNWTSRKCVGMKLAKLTADAVRFFSLSLSRPLSVSFGAHFYCSINV